MAKVVCHSIFIVFVYVSVHSLLIAYSALDANWVGEKQILDQPYH